MSVRMLRLQAQRCAYAGLGFPEAPEVVKHASEIVVRLGKVGLQTQRPAQALLGLVQAVKVSQRVAAVVPDLRNVAPERKCTIIADQRFLVTSACGEITPKLVPKLRASGRKGIFDVCKKHKFDVFPNQSRPRPRSPRVPQNATKTGPNAVPG